MFITHESKMQKNSNYHVINTFSEYFIAIGYESKSSLAAIRRQGTPEPVFSPSLEKSISNSDALFKEYSSELKNQKNMSIYILAISLTR